MPSAPNRGAAYRDPRYRERRDETIALLKNVPTLPGILAQHGYLSLQTGKWWMGHYTRGGFTHGMTEGDPARGGRHGDAGLRIGRETLQPIYDFIDLSAREEKPFFIWYAPMLPHDPHTPPARFLDRHLQQAPSIHVARYWAMVEWFDETCGALLDHLAQRGLADNTIVAYLADNGWIQSTDNPRYAPKSKQSPYDGGLRTPIILRWPGHVRPERSEMAVSSIDLLPTLLRAVQIVPPANLPGIDLLNPGAGQTRKAVFGACFTHDAIDIQQPARNLRWRWTVADRWKLILPDPVNEPDGAAELYDLTADPHETRNLAQEPGAPLSQLRETADGWWRPHP